MRIRVRLFAAAREAAGRDAIEVDLPEGATFGELRRRLAEMPAEASTPTLAGLMKTAVFAADMKYADDDEQVPAQAEIALIPPVSGG